LAERRSKSSGDKKYREPEPPNTSELPELPEGWVWTKFGQIFNVFVGSTPSRKEPSFWGGHIPWVSSGEVAFCRIKQTKESITTEGLNSSSTKVHPVGTVMLGMIGEGKTRGQAAILDIAAAHNQNTAAIRVSETPIPPEYVYYYLEYRYLETRQVGAGNNQQALNKALVEDFVLPLPPLDELAIIVREVDRRLSEADRLEATLQANLKRAERLRQAILKKAFSGELVPQDPNDEPASVLLERIRASRAQAPKKGKRKQ
jgi:type I restriction enzyme S subunit